MQQISKEVALANGGKRIEIFEKEYTVYFNNGKQRALMLDVGLSIAEIAHTFIGQMAEKPEDYLLEKVAFYGLQYFHEEITMEDIAEMVFDEPTTMLIYHAMLNSKKTEQQICDEADRASDAIAAMMNSLGDASQQVVEKMQGKKELSDSGTELKETPSSSSVSVPQSSTN